MLEYLRNAADKPVAKILIGILAFSFVGWGVAEWIFGNVVSDTTLVRVGGDGVSVQQFSAEKSRQIAALPREEMRKIYTDAAAGADFQNQVLTKLTGEKMAEVRANDLGFIVTDARIAAEIRTMPEFQNNGKFSTLMFDMVLGNSGYSEAEFAAVLRNQILRQMVLGVVGAPMTVPQFAVDAAYRARYATRDIEYARIAFADFKTAAPTDEQLREYYAQNPQTIDEVRTVSYILVAADMDKPDAADAAHNIARAIEDDIIAGDAMRDVAARHKAKYVTLAPFARGANTGDAVMNDAMVARAFDMAAGEESELIELKNGLVIMRVDNIVPAHPAEFDAVKKSLIADWTRDAQKKDAYLRANDILVDVNAGGPMAGKRFATVSRAAGAPAAVLSTAFNSAIGTNAIVQDTDAFYVVSVKGEKAPAADAKKKNTLRTELQNMATKELIDDYNAFLRREYPIKINEKVYRRFVSQQ